MTTLKELRQLSAAATPGEWTRRGATIRYAADREVLADNNGGASTPVRVNTTGRYGVWEADADLIVASVNYVRSLLQADQPSGDGDE